MCTHQREIKNKYTGRTLYVKCGKCPACQQEKAAYRVSRIKAQDSKELDTVLVGLTYRRHCVPYVLRDEAFKFSRGEIKTLNIYRDTSFRKVRQNAAYDIDYKPLSVTSVLGSVDFVNSCDFNKLHDLRGDSGKIGVGFYPDVQRFLARLRLNLKRNFNFNHEFKVFVCSEYGAGRVKGKGIFRPHFHLLFWIPKGNYEVFRSAVVASWPYGDLQKWPRAIEKAYRASSYVASYVNCDTDFPKFLKQYFKPKHSYSKGFGCNKDLFSLPKILEHFSRGHLTFNMLKNAENVPAVVELPYPQYIIHRYFPKFKGYGRLSSSTLLSLMQRINGLEGDGKSLVYSNISDESFINMLSFPVYYSFDDLYKICVRLRNAYERFCIFAPVGFDRSFSSYCRLHVAVWSLYSSDVLRLHLQNEEIPLNEKYDNLESVKLLNERYGKPLPCGFTHEMLKNTDPNKFPSNIRNSSRFEISYFEHLKHRRVSNSIMMIENEEF